MAAVRAKESALKLEPVYLVEPLPEPEPSSRRTWLSLGLAFAVGGLVGFYPGLRVGQGGTSGEVVDDELQHLRWLAVEAPISDLKAEAGYYLHLLGWKYAGEELLWRGFDRLAAELLAGDANRERVELAKFAVAIAGQSSMGSSASRSHLIGALRAIK